MFFKIRNEIDLITTNELNLTSTQLISKKLENFIVSQKNQLYDYAIYISFYFIAIKSKFNYLLNIFNPKNYEFLEMILIQLFNQNKYIKILVPLSNLIISTFILYSILYYFFNIISLFFKKLFECRKFCYKFGWYFSALSLFNMFIPLLPNNLLLIVYSICGIPVHCYIFSIFQSYLPDFYIRYTYSENLMNLNELKFVADVNYLGIVLYSLLFMMFVCVVFSIRLFNESEEKPIEIVMKCVDNQNNEEEIKENIEKEEQTETKEEIKEEIKKEVKEEIKENKKQNKKSSKKSNKKTTKKQNKKVKND